MVQFKCIFALLLPYSHTHTHTYQDSNTQIENDDEDRGVEDILLFYLLLNREFIVSVQEAFISLWVAPIGMQIRANFCEMTNRKCYAIVYVEIENGKYLHQKN